MDAFNERAGPNTTPVADTRGRSRRFEFRKISTLCQRGYSPDARTKLLPHPGAVAMRHTNRSLDRLARSTRDLLNVLDAIGKAGAGFKSLADTWADTTTPHGRLMLTVGSRSSNGS
jgi:resolvase-like protein